MKRDAIARLAFIAALANAATASANNDFWKGAVSGTWSAASNWQDGSVPISGDQASFQNPGTYGISFSAAPTTIQDLFVINAGTNVTFASVGAVRTLSATSVSGGRDALVSDGATLTLGILSQPLNLVVGDDLRAQLGGTLNIAHGSTATTADFFASAGGTISVLASSSVSATGTGTIGSGFGGATLNISGGGTVSSSAGIVGDVSGTSGTVNIDGANSKWTSTALTVGKNSTGMIGLTHGGTLVSTQATIASQSGSTGEVDVTGSGSNWTNSYPSGTDGLFIGSNGAGKLTISAGGSVANYQATIGFVGSAASSAMVEGIGSKWTNTNSLFIGGTSGTTNVGGNGTLTIKSGGQVTSNSGFIGYSPGSTGVVTVGDTGSSWKVNDSLAVGLFGAGTLNINAGGTVTVAQTLFAYNSVNLHGGTLDAAMITATNDGPFNWTSGTLHVGTFAGNLLNQGGKLSPGHSAGFTAITGNYTQQSTGVVAIEIGAPPAMTSANDFVNVSGVATLGGELHVSFLNGFLHAAADNFGILRGMGGIGGAFSNAADGQRLATTDGLASFVVRYGPASPFDHTLVMLTNFVTALPGDYNNNGAVDAADYVVWRNGLGTTYNQNEYDVWRSHFGQTAGSGSGANVSSPVPEPATLVMLMFAAAGWCLRRGRAA